MSETVGNLGIIVGGGPAPGINGVIAAVTIEARKRNLNVYGICEGYRWLVKGDEDKLRKNVKELKIADVSRIHFDGGSILRTSRTNPKKEPNGIENAVKMLKALGIQYLVTIGGDDTAFGASAIAQAAKGEIRFVHVPKTIDNDLPLPNNLPTFGYQTARELGTTLVKNLMEDARTTDRWYIVVAMGRSAGHLALGIAKSAGATLAIIPEEFGFDEKGKPNKVPFAKICDIFETSIIKRRAMDHNHGVIVVAEGIIDSIGAEELEKMGIVLEYDPFGNPILGNVDLGKLIKKEIEKRFKARGDKFTTVDINIGYVLRCTDPIPYDQEYTRDLGYCAMKYLMNPVDNEDVLVYVDNNEMKTLAFKSILDEHTGKIKIRYVNTNSATYKVARNYMVRLNQRDFEDTDLLEKMAKIAKISVEEFRKRYESLI